MADSYSTENDEAAAYRAAKERYREALRAHGAAYAAHLADSAATETEWDAHLIHLAALERLALAAQQNADFMQERCREGQPMCERGCGCEDHEWFEQALMYEIPRGRRQSPGSKGLLRRGLKIHAAWLVKKGIW